MDFCSDRSRDCVQNLKFVPLPAPEIIVIGALGGDNSGYQWHSQTSVSGGAQPAASPGVRD